MFSSRSCATIKLLCSRGAETEIALHCKVRNTAIGNLVPVLSTPVGDTQCVDLRLTGGKLLRAQGIAFPVIGTNSRDVIG